MRNEEWRRKEILTRYCCDQGVEKSRRERMMRKTGSTDVVAVILISAEQV